MLVRTVSKLFFFLSLGAFDSYTDSNGSHHRLPGFFKFCPPNCTCEGYAYTCRLVYDQYHHPFARYLDLSESLPWKQSEANRDVTEDYGDFHGYIRLYNLSFLELKDVELNYLWQLRVLDLSGNLLTDLSTLKWTNMAALTHLNLSKNPLLPVLDHHLTDLAIKSDMSSLASLRLRNTGMGDILGQIVCEHLLE